MARRAGGLVVTFDAGTAQFFKDTAAVEGRVKAFGQTTNALGSSLGGTRREMVAASTAIKELEGNFTGSSRAVARFAVDTLKLGPILSAAFPVIGILAFGGVLTKIGEGVFKFFNDIAQAPEKIKGAFANANNAIRSTDDELKVANDRLENDIAKLEGKRQNNLKVALDEAAASADKLAIALEKDLDASYKILKENAPSVFEQLGQTGLNFKDVLKVLSQGPSGAASVALKAGTNIASQDIAGFVGGQTGVGGLIGRINQIQSDAAKAIDATRSSNLSPEAKIKEENQIIQAQNQAFLNEYKKGLDFVTNALKTADTAAQKERLQNFGENLQRQISLTNDQIRNTALKAQSTALNIGNENDRPEQKIQERINLLKSELQGVQLKIGQEEAPESVKLANQARAESLKIYEELQKILDTYKLKLSDADKATIGSTILLKDQITEQNTWNQSLHNANVATEQRVDALRRLTTAIGAGYEATQKAILANETEAKFGERLKDPALNTPVLQRQIQNFQLERSSELEAEHGKAIGETTQKLKEQVQLELAVAGVRSQGEAAVREVELAQRILNIQLHEGMSATQAQIQAEKELASARQAGEIAESIGKIQERTAAIKNLTQAIGQGEEAMRQAELANQIAESRRAHGGIPLPGTIFTQEDIERGAESQATRNQSIQQAGIATDRIYAIDQEIEKLQQVKATGNEYLTVQIKLRDLQNERLKAWAEELYKIGTLRDGLRAFFVSAQEEAKKPGQVLYDSLHSAVDKLSDELTKLLTGQKASWGKFFKSIGEDLLKETIKSGILKTLGGIASKIPGLGTKAPPSATKIGPTGYPSDPIYVVIEDQNANPPASGPYGNLPINRPAPPIPSIGGQVQSAGVGAAVSNVAQGLGRILGGIFTPGGGHATGGDVSPGSAYMVGERGPEPFFPNTSGTILSNALARRHFGAGNSGMSIGYIDARGTDPALTYQNVARAIQDSQSNSIAHSVRATVQRSARVPVGK